MKTWQEQGRSAFPLPDCCASGTYLEGGMSLRDYFAAQVLPAVYERAQIIAVRSDKWEGYVAEKVYAIADAMLRERDL